MGKERGFKPPNGPGFKNGGFTGGGKPFKNGAHGSKSKRGGSTDARGM